MASRKNYLTIQPPIGGINRRVGFQNQPPFTTYYSLNYWPIDVLTGRSISATRPPIEDAVAPSGDGPVNMLIRLNGAVEGKPLQSMLTARDGDVYWWNDDEWVVATGTEAGNAETTIPLYGATFLQKSYIPSIGEKPLVFDYTTGELTRLVESAGICPEDCRIITTWQGALIIAGNIESPHILFMSRVGNATDWNFAAPITDTGGAFFTGGENEGLLRGPITAIFAHTADTMIVSTTEGLVAFRGHPRQGGIAEDIPSSAYIMGQGAWTKGPGGTAYFLTRLGMMSLGTGVNDVPTLISRDKVPDELVGLGYDYENPVINMEYDSRFNGIHITIRGDEEQYWWYDLQSGGFHLQTMAEYPWVLMEYFPFATANQSGVLMGGDGYGGIGQMDRLGSEDFASSIVLGPVPISRNPQEKSIVSRMVTTFGGVNPTTNGTFSLSGGADGEDSIRRLMNGGAQFTTTLDALANNNGVCYPKVAGHAMSCRYDQESGRNAIEQATLDLHQAGLNRMVRFRIDPFASAACVGYVSATPQVQPSEDIEDGIEIINMGLFPEEWWDLANEDGGNVRVTDQNNNFLPFDLLGFLKTSEDEENPELARVDEGAIVLRRPIPAADSEPVRVWVCINNLARFPLGYAFGQYNAYPPWFIAVWPGGYGPNRLEFDWPLVPDGSPTPEEQYRMENPYSLPNPGGSGTGSPNEELEVPTTVVITCMVKAPVDVYPNFPSACTVGEITPNYGIFIEAVQVENEDGTITNPNSGGQGDEINPSIYTGTRIASTACALGDPGEEGDESFGTLESDMHQWHNILSPQVAPYLGPVSVSTQAGHIPSEWSVQRITVNHQELTATIEGLTWDDSFPNVVNPVVLAIPPGVRFNRYVFGDGPFYSVDDLIERQNDGRLDGSVPEASGMSISNVKTPSVQVYQAGAEPAMSMYEVALNDPSVYWSAWSFTASNTVIGTPPA